MSVALQRVAVIASHVRPPCSVRHSPCCHATLCAASDSCGNDLGSAVVFMENPKAPAPSHAEKARTLMAGQRQGFLATTHHQLGAPYGTLINLATCPESGMPFTVISRMAEHTANLQKSSVCSVLVTEAQGSGDQLAVSRCTCVGEMERVEKTPGRRAAFLSNHSSATYVDFDDFQCWRLKCDRLRYIGGFGEMSWVDGSAFQAARPDDIAAGSRGAVDHMNEDHQDAVLAMTQAFGGLPGATSATLLSLDRHGFEVLAVTGEGRRRTRVPFETTLSHLDDIRPAVVAMTERARTLLGLPAPKSGH
mmetsp:Transcript_23979/g.67278  ORF Transcript_23979/g.67278 Transcript_23979/m.67278 type:complete len:306 (+) Transcript_23979:116-1033(+)